MTATTRRVAVVGGGLAGITAALRCADAGCAVTLFEARPYLGGLTHSFRRGELQVDNGQHVFLRCCTSYRALLHRLGVADRVRLQPRLAIPVRSPGADRAVWLRRRHPLPAPAHLAGALLRYRPLSPGERARFARAALALRRVDPAAPATDRRSFGDWLREHGQSDRAVAALWDLFGVATLNAPADGASLALAATVFQLGLLTDPAAADIGWSRVPLRRLHGDPARICLAAAGAEVRTATAARGIEPRDGGWRVITDAGATVVDQVVLAVPPGPAERLLPAGSVEQAPGWSRRLGSVPIVNVHVVLDRPVLDVPFVAGIGTPVQWVFDRTGPSGSAEGQYLAVSLSAADELVGVPTAALRARLLPELAALLPGLRDATVRDFFVTRERHATFRPAPGSAALRPPGRTAARGLVLAGAWTATGWPATMEGAVRSGEAAAALLDRSAPDAHPSWSAHPPARSPTGVMP
ncbi:hydroxysqualene dehydroxylase HpnE [Pseudonocardia acidicola]|uniref:hydroxysqualene dehydroxylase HpnE n=1 Tax=Pseudonocardia acidicola TaxID=2724939 RepID=UPI0030846634